LCVTYLRWKVFWNLSKIILFKLYLVVYTVCNLLNVSGGWETQRCHHLVTRLMTVTDLPQVVPTRLIQAVRITSYFELVVNNLLHADDIRLVGTTCCESVGLINLAKMITTCSRLSQQLGTSNANTSCWQAVRFLRVYQMLFQQFVIRMCSQYLFPACWEFATKLLTPTDL
jgi:hypothetical protein